MIQSLLLVYLASSTVFADNGPWWPEDCLDVAGLVKAPWKPVEQGVPYDKLVQQWKAKPSFALSRALALRAKTLEDITAFESAMGKSRKGKRLADETVYAVRLLSHRMSYRGALWLLMPHKWKEVPELGRLQDLIADAGWQVQREGLYDDPLPLLALHMDSFFPIQVDGLSRWLDDWRKSLWVDEGRAVLRPSILHNLVRTAHTQDGISAGWIGPRFAAEGKGPLDRYFGAALMVAEGHSRQEERKRLTQLSTDPALPALWRRKAGEYLKTGDGSRLYIGKRDLELRPPGSSPVNLN